MQKLLSTIESAVVEKYQEIRQEGEILQGIKNVNRQVRYKYPELAVHIKKRMLDIAEKNGDLP